MPRTRLADLHRPDAAFAALAVQAAQAGDNDEAERLARIADRFGRLQLKLPEGELQRLSRLRNLQRRLELLELRLAPIFEFMEAMWTERRDTAVAAAASPEATEA